MGTYAERAASFFCPLSLFAPGQRRDLACRSKKKKLPREWSSLAGGSEIAYMTPRDLRRIGAASLLFCLYFVREAERGMLSLMEWGGWRCASRIFTRLKPPN